MDTKKIDEKLVDYLKNIDSNQTIGESEIELNSNKNLLNSNLKEFINIVENTDFNLKNKILSEYETIVEISEKLKNIYSTDEKSKLWIYGCSMSNKHLLETHDETWYSLLAKKLDMELVIRSHEGFGINAIERTIISDLADINPKNDLVIFSPSFWHRVYIMEFKDGRRGFYPNEKQCAWYSDMRDFDEIIKMNYERWISICEILIKLGINFRTWLLSSPLIEEYPFQNAKRISKFENFILKPRLAIQTLDWMSYQKQHPEFWFCNEKGKEDYHFNLKGHSHISTEFYKQIKNIKDLF